MTPLFVIGAPRSGTTVTRTLLQGFNEVYLLPDEFQILPRFAAKADIGAKAEDLADLVEGSAFAGHMRRRGIWPGRDVLAQAISGLDTAGAFHALVLTVAEADHAGVPLFWGDKTPETVFHLDLVQRLWPDALFLEVVRDPRATVHSMRRAWGRSVLRGAVVWRDAQIATQKFVEAYGSDRVHRLVFESLISEPDIALDRVGAWLNLDFDHSILETVSSEERWGQAAGLIGVQKHTSDWQIALSPKELRLIEEICYETMQRAGYSPAVAEASFEPGRTAILGAKAGDAFRVLHAYARERGWTRALKYKLSQWRNS